MRTEWRAGASDGLERAPCALCAVGQSFGIFSGSEYREKSRDSAAKATVDPTSTACTTETQTSRQSGRRDDHQEPGSYPDMAPCGPAAGLAVSSVSLATEHAVWEDR